MKEDSEKLRVRVTVDLPTGGRIRFTPLHGEVPTQEEFREWLKNFRKRPPIGCREILWSSM
jgi:hypothetical protein